MPRTNAAETIIAAAEDCLIAGEGEFEMNDVAAAAGVSEGLAYHYYGSKAGLLNAVTDRFYTRYHAVMNERFEGAIEWSQRERKRLQSVIDFLYSERLAPVILGRLAQTPYVAAADIKGQVETIELSIRNIRDGIKRGFINETVDPRIAGPAIVGAVSNAVCFAMSAKRPPAATTLTRQLWGLIEGALGLNRP